MHSLQKQFHDFISVNHLIHSGEKVLLAVSGGLDSMTMCHLFLEGGYDFAIAHCNFGLRAKESDGDEAFVRSWAEKQGVGCYVKRVGLKGSSTQLAAREARYQWFGELMETYGFDKLATAHHLNDSLETSLINFVRGTGIRGLSGIKPINNAVIRPLLFATRSAIKAYAVQYDIDWMEDSTNAQEYYDRNYVRHQVVPRLQELNVSLLKTYSDTSERLQLTLQVLEQRVNAIKNEFLIPNHEGYKLGLSWIKSESDSLMLAEILSGFGFNYVTCKEVYQSIGKSGKHFSSTDWMLNVDRGCIYINANDSQSLHTVQINGLGTTQTAWGHFEMEQIDYAESLPFGNPHLAFMDFDKVAFPMVLRTWQDGDKFKPLGMSGYKKVSDFFIDSKVSNSDKHRTWLLESKGEIVWIVGHRISDDFKVTSDAKRLLKVFFTPPKFS